MFEKFKKWYFKISVRIPIVFFLSFMVLLLFTIFMVFFRFRSRMLSDYKQMAEGITSMMVSQIDGDKVDLYIDQNFKNPEYNELCDYFNQLYDNYPDVLYLYVYQVKEDGGHVVFDMDREDPDPPGFVYEIDEHFADRIDEIMAGKEIPAYVIHTHEEYGYEYLLSYLKPVYDSKGNYACSAGVDFSMDKIFRDDVRFVVTLAMVMTLIMLIVFVCDVIIIKRTVSLPLEKMIKCINEFDYSTNEDRLEHIKAMEDINVHTNNEIEMVYHAFLSSMKEAHFYMKKLSDAKKTIQDNEEKIKYMGQTMYKDSLTGVGNKAAYLEMIEKINKHCSSNLVPFAVVMADINNLKYVNDTFGHEKGDLYIKGCCNILCSLYVHSPVYRIGGDEFVVILQDHDYERRQVLYAKTMIAFTNSYKAVNKDPWERFSMSLGMASHMKGNTYQDTFKMADKNMYETKTRFKEQYGSYR